MEKLRKTLPARVGLYTVGLAAYWNQFPGLRERLLEYGIFIERKMTGMGALVFNFGLVDSQMTGKEAGAYFAQQGIDILFVHSGTYITSDSVLPVHQLCGAKTVVLNLQPAVRINYEKTNTAEWLAHCGACSVPELTNAFERAGLACHVVNGLLGLDYTPLVSMTDENTADRPEALRAWQSIQEWIGAATVKRNLQNCRIGFLGNAYSGMLDMYSDLTMLQAQTGVHIKVLEMCDLDRLLRTVTQDQINEKLEEMNEFFEISEDSPSEPLAKKPTSEQLFWSAKVAAAQELLVQEQQLDALAYYYHGAPGNDYERLQSGFIVGHSLLTAKGIPCAGEGDLKTCIAMKICDIAQRGGSFCEIVTTDYTDGTILMGHDGPFHIAIAKGKPILRGMGVYHGKQGTGISVEAKVKTGPITNLGITQTLNGRLKMIITEAQATNGPIMTIGNTQTPVLFSKSPDEYMDAWFKEAPIHHFAMSVGGNASLFKKIGLILEMDNVIL